MGTNVYFIRALGYIYKLIASLFTVPIKGNPVVFNNIYVYIYVDYVT